MRLRPAATVGLKSALRHGFVELLLRIVLVGQMLSIKNLGNSRHFAEYVPAYCCGQSALNIITGAATPKVAM